MKPTTLALAIAKAYGSKQLSYTLRTLSLDAGIKP